ncbi:MAG TPA: flavodoxin domain-containing protein [Candidatus Omnitrophota bacterium]|nr:flavodoxin domain-containing protein [Candidatus Omnitrophota bacterium]HPT07870.1 flavodoxin domain-containing protein [Candidatus Omnitrophota bacterium]
MNAVAIKKDIYWVGVVDWNIRTFHGHTYTTNRGSTYNAYLIIDDKVTLVDTVLGSFSAELIDRIKSVIPLEKIDYIIANHVETDHSGALPALMKLCPKAKIFGTAKCKEGLWKHYYGDWDFQIVKTGDTLKLGKRTLSFIEAPMIHWPDSMFTYCPEEKLLMPNDAFGQHYATSQRFDDEVDQCALMQEAVKYYANILWPLSSVIAKKIDDILKMNIPISMIAPSHGIIWRNDPMKIVNSYITWAKNTTKTKAVIVYETMWRSTETMARQLAEGLAAGGISDVKIFDIAESDVTAVITELIDAKAVLVGSSTQDNDMLPNIARFMEFLKGLKPKGRVGMAFGSFGWAGGAVKEIEGVLKETGVDVAAPGVSLQYVPDAAGRLACFEAGKNFAEKIK